jgi:hypothetical protein
MASELRINPDKVYVSPSLSCGQCGKSNTDIKLQKCGRCGLQAYCGKACQKKHWPTHKTVCHLKTKEVTESPTSKTSLVFPKNFSDNAIISKAPLNDPQTVARANQVRQEAMTSFSMGIDQGIAKALEYFKQAIDSIAQKGDDYGQLLKQLVFLDSEHKAIQLMSNWDDEKQQLIFEECLDLRYSNQNSIICDVLRLTALQKRFVLLCHLFERIKHYQLEHNRHDNEDRFGWNIAHFVALHSTNGEFPLTNISEVNALLDVKNKSGASPRDFLYWLSKPEPISVPAFGNEHSRLSPIQFQQEINSNYWIRPCFTPGSLLRTCFEDCETNDPEYLSTLIKQKINNYIDNIKNGTNILNLKIRKMQEPTQMKGEWECLASRDVKKGEILALYSGIVTHWWDGLKLGGKAFRVCNQLYVDTDLSGGSLAQFINHGFPNCAVLCHLYQGLPMITIIALENLPANTTLFLTYGNKYFKEHEINYLNLNQKGIDDYLQATKMLKRVPFLEVSADGLEYYYADCGKTPKKKVDARLSESAAIDAWSNKARLEYLANYHLDEMKQRLGKLEYDFLERGFKKK